MDIFEWVLSIELVYIDDPDFENIEDAVMRAVRTVCGDGSCGGRISFGVSGMPA